MRKSDVRWSVSIALIGLFCGVLAGGCARKRVDPVDALKAMVPRMEAALNRRDIAALQKLGTSQFASNRLIIDVFGANRTDTVDLQIKHLTQLPGKAQLTLGIVARGEEDLAVGMLTLQMVGDGNWRIDSYDLSLPPPAPDADTSRSGGG